MSKESLANLQDYLGYTFQDKALLDQAFRHSSATKQNQQSYERLEFLGDSVLELAVSKYLFLNYKNPEGELTNFRAALVRTETLAKISREIGFNDFIYPLVQSNRFIKNYNCYYFRRSSLRNFNLFIERV